MQGVVETIAQNGAHGVRAAVKILCDVVSHVWDTELCEVVANGDKAVVEGGSVVVVGLVRRENLVAHSGTVDVEFKVAQSGAEKQCRLDISLDAELAPQKWRG